MSCSGAGSAVWVLACSGEPFGCVLAVLLDGPAEGVTSSPMAQEKALALSVRVGWEWRSDRSANETVGRKADAW